MVRGYGLKAATSLSLLAAAMGGCVESGPEGGDPVNRQYNSPVLTHIDADKMTILDSEKQYLRSMYAGIARWSGERVTARLVFVEGGDEFVCHRSASVETVVTSRTSPAYCPQPDAVVMTGAWVRLRASDLGRGGGTVTYEPAYDYALAHEVWHNLELHGTERTDGVTSERKADCFAGRIMGKMMEQGLRDVDSVGDTVAVIREFPADAEHGDSSGRVAAYMEGVAGGNC